MAQDAPTKFSEWVHRDAPTYSRDRIAVMGDAAHAMVPFQASGVTQSLEDAVILSAVLGAVTSKKDVPAALRAYDAMRRPRSQSVVASSYTTALMCIGNVPDIGLDPVKLKAGLESRWDFIMDFDLEEHRRTAVSLMQEELRKDE